jgi:acetolactate synthase-1/2/3 large subunit
MGSRLGATTASRQRDVAAALVAACREAGTTHLFGVPGGGSNLDLVGAAEAIGIPFVLVHGETAGAVMAGVAGELTGAPGLCVATRGPGAASAVNGVAQALLDRQPMVLVTDSVAHSEERRVSHQRLQHQELFGPATRTRRPAWSSSRWVPGLARCTWTSIRAPRGAPCRGQLRSPRWTTSRSAVPGC